MYIIFSHVELRVLIEEKEFFKIVNSNVFAHLVHRQDIRFFIYNKMIKDSCMKFKKNMLEIFNQSHSYICYYVIIISSIMTISILFCYLSHNFSI